MLKIILDISKCVGCRTCELACSYHHSNHKVFNPRMSSTKLFRDNEKGNITICIDSTCDNCANEKQPLCVKYCAYGARSVVI